MDVQLTYCRNCGTAGGHTWPCPVVDWTPCEVCGRPTGGCCTVMRKESGMPDFRRWWNAVPDGEKEKVSRKDVWDAAVAATRAELAGPVPSVAEELDGDAAPAPAPRRRRRA